MPGLAVASVADGYRCSSSSPATLVAFEPSPPPAGDGKCVVCDSHTRPTTIVRVCDECTAGSLASRCVTCGAAGVSDAYYCAACVALEKDRDGCPTIVNVGTAKADAFFANKKFGKGGGR